MDPPHFLEEILFHLRRQFHRDGSYGPGRDGIRRLDCRVETSSGEAGEPGESGVETSFVKWKVSWRMGPHLPVSS